MITAAFHAIHPLSDTKVQGSACCAPKDRVQLRAERELSWSLLDIPGPVKSRQGSRGEQLRAPAGQARYRQKLVDKKIS